MKKDILKFPVRVTHTQPVNPDDVGECVKKQPKPVEYKTKQVVEARHKQQVLERARQLQEDGQQYSGGCRVSEGTVSKKD